MSLQLIIYPQQYNGVNPISGFGNQMVVDGIAFNTINSSSSYDSSASNIILDSLTNQPAALLNTWYRFRNSTNPPTLPTETNGNVVLNAGTSASQTSGIYQKMSGLNVGVTYEIELKMIPSTGSGANAGYILPSIYNNTTLVTQPLFSATASTITHTFTATNTTQTLVITFIKVPSTGAQKNPEVKSASVRQTSPTNPTSIQDLDNGQVLCDLYEDEDIPLTLSVDNFTNAAEKVQSYSKAFNLPATKRNNKIFDNIFEVTRTTTGLAFNPYIKTQCELKQDGFVLFEGYLRLIDITDKNGEVSYNVNLYSEVVALADVLKERLFSDLDLSELSHEYNRTNIYNSWNTSGSTISWLNSNDSGFRTDYTTFKYPFVDWTHEYTIDATGNPVLPNLDSTFRPFISVRYLIDRIFNQPSFPFTYTSAFFDTADFKKLYMDFNWGNSEIEQGTGLTATPTSTGSYNNIYFDSNDFPSAAGWDTTNKKFVAQADNTLIKLTGSIQVFNTFTGAMVFFRIIHKDSSGGFISSDTVTPWGLNTSSVGTGVYPTWNLAYKYIMALNDTIELQWVANLNYSTMMVSQVTVTTGVQQMTDQTMLNGLRGELKQWDFLKGIINMFNLVTMPDSNDPNNILIEPYNDIFLENSDSKQLDWTEKVDTSQVKLTPLTDLNKITKFVFEEDEDDYAFRIYKQSTQGHEYGSKTYDASGFTILQGEEEVSASPFAATISKPLEPMWQNLIVPTIYGLSDDGISEGIENSPRIMYNNGVVQIGVTYHIPAQNGVASDDADEYLRFSHLTDIPTVTTSPPAPTDTRDFHFGECQMFDGLGQPTTNNLFNTYWLPYFNELYNPDTRTVSLRVKLTASDISTFNFYDTVFIKSREYRVNKIDYKPNDLAIVELILIP